MRVEVRWSWVEDEADEAWNATRCLFAFCDPENDEILYVGHADDRNVRDHCEASEHEVLWQELRAIGIDNVSVLIGVPQDARLRSDNVLLGELASLLITELDPSGNEERDAERPVRPGLEIECSGEWPYEEATFAPLE